MGAPRAYYASGRAQMRSSNCWDYCWAGKNSSFEVARHFRGHCDAQSLGQAVGADMFKQLLGQALGHSEMDSQSLVPEWSAERENANLSERRTCSEANCKRKALSQVKRDLKRLAPEWPQRRALARPPEESTHVQEIVRFKREAN